MCRALRFKVVEWVVQQWDSNPDIAELLGPARRAVQPSVLLQEEMCRSYGDCAVRSKEDYSALMQRDGVYGDQAEAAVAAYLSGVSLDIYVRLPLSHLNFFPAIPLCTCRLVPACQSHVRLTRNRARSLPAGSVDAASHGRDLQSHGRSRADVPGGERPWAGDQRRDADGAAEESGPGAGGALPDPAPGGTAI